VDAFNEVAELTRQAYPQVIGHAGASGYVPESSLIGYDLAANLLADYSEPDLVLTKDNYFIASHDLTLEGTTNVGDLFPAARMSTFVIEGVAITGYYAINFTLRWRLVVIAVELFMMTDMDGVLYSEIKTLRIKQRFEGRSTLYNWIYSPPTLEEIIQWQLDHYAVSGRLVGIYPEIKHPDWYNEMGYRMEDLFIEVLKNAGYHYDINDSLTPRDLRSVVPIAIQCFKVPNLKYLATITNIPLVQLIGTSAEFPTPLMTWNEAVLDEVATYAQVASPGMRLLLCINIVWKFSGPL
jgi:glycerophosphoryl diester phosphodiesterase